MSTNEELIGAVGPWTLNHDKRSGYRLTHTSATGQQQAIGALTLDDLRHLAGLENVIDDHLTEKLLDDMTAAKGVNR